MTEVVGYPGKALIEQDRSAIAHLVRTELRDRTSNDLAADRRPPLVWVEANLDGTPREQPVARLDEGARGRHVDDGGVDPGPHPRRDDAVLGDRLPAPRQTPFKQMWRHTGRHSRERESNRYIRTRAVAPTRRMAYWASPRPLMYSVPDEDVPSALKLTMLLTPNRIGSSPGAGLPASIAGRPGSVPKSTPLNWLDSSSGEWS